MMIGRMGGGASIAIATSTIGDLMIRGGSAIVAIGLTNDPKVPEHHVRDDDLMMKGPPRIGKFDMG